jgi:hypothetical protein
LLVVPTLPERTRAILIYTWEHECLMLYNE